MKKIYFMLLAMLATGVTFTACSDEDPFSTATPDDEPRIIAPIFPDRDKGQLPVIADIGRDENFEMTLTTTPADYTTVVWLIDGKEVHTGKEIDINLNAGTYGLKVTVSTADKSTYREAIVKVNPLPDDPWSTDVGFERIIVPGTKALLYGDNLDKVESIMIDGKTITSLVYLTPVDESPYIEYEVPEDVSDGEHRVILIDEAGFMYGANTVNVTRNALIISGANRTKANTEWVMTGVNLDQIASLTMGGQTISEFTRQSATEIALICPDVADGDYTLTGKTKGGNDVEFYKNGITTENTVSVTSRTVLWEGHHYVSWDLSDDNPNKLFNMISKDTFAQIGAGATLSISYSVASEADYHKMETRTAHWTVLPGTDAVEFTQDGSIDVVLTQEMLDLIQQQDGFIIVGHGFYVDLVTLD